MVMPCSRSAARPSTSSAKSMSPPCVPTFFESASSAASWSSKIIFESYSRRPISVLLPSSTLPQVMKRSRLLCSCWSQIRLDVAGDQVADVCHQKYPSCFFFSIDAGWSWSMTRPCRSEVVVSSISWMIAGQRVGLALDRAGQRVAAERAEAHLLQHRLLARLQRHALVVDHDQRAVALDHRPLRREVQRHDRDVLQVDVLPDVELGPVRHREHADALALVLARVVQAPQLGALVLRVPAVLAAAEREDALLGAALLLVAARAAEGRVEAVTGRAPASAPASS